MDTLLSIKVFCHVVGTRSFIAAANQLGLSAAMTSRHIAHLEKHVGSRLLNRNTRQLSLTENGKQYYSHCKQMIDQLEMVEADIGNHTTAPRGRLRITAPIPLGTKYLTQPIKQFLEKYPDIELDIHLSDKEESLAEEAFDLALRIGHNTNSSLFARKLCTINLALLCSPDYAAQYGLPQSLQDLSKHKAISYSYLTDDEHWNFFTEDGLRCQKIHPTIRVNNGDMAISAAISGLGIASQPTFMAAEALCNNKLIKVLPQYRQIEPSLYIVYLSRHFLSASVRAFIDFMAEWFKEDYKWCGGDALQVC